MTILKLNLDHTLISEQALALMMEKTKVAFMSLREKTCVGGQTHTGWFDWPRQQGFKLIREIEAYFQEHPVNYDSVVVIGIGGSYNGTRAVEQALNHSFGHELGSGYKPIYYLGQHLSETQTLELFDLLAEKNPIVITVSKSGRTLEPSLGFRLAKAFLAARYPKGYAERVLIVTEDSNASTLKRLAEREGFGLFYLPKDVGGRYSVLSAVGILPLFYAGYPVHQLMNGAHLFFDSLHKEDWQKSPALELASLRQLYWDQGKRVDLIAISEPKLQSFCEWWKQLFGESEGKRDKGLLPSSLVYPTDLHSMGQYLQEGVNQMIETFLSFDRYESVPTGLVERRLRVPFLSDNSDGLSYLEGKNLSEINQAAFSAAIFAHASRGVPCPHIQVAQLDAFSLGYLFAFFQTVCAVSGLLLEVNPFDQPGVETYKQKMYELLEQN